MSFVSFLYFFSSALSFLYAIGELCVRKPKKNNLILFFIFISIGIIQVHASLMLSGLLMAYLDLFQTQLPFFYLLGPLILHYIQIKISRSTINRLFVLHYIPALFIAIVLIPYYASSDLNKYLQLQLFVSSINNPIINFQNLVFILGFVHLLFYCLLIVFTVLPALSTSMIKKEPVIKISFFIIIYSMLNCIVAVASILSTWTTGMYISVSMIAILIPFLYIIRQRIPEFFMELEKIVEKEKYNKSQLHSLDLNDLKERLNALMQKDNYFTEDTLKLQDLAKQLNITPHQLSEYLNNNLGLSFAGYINQWRISQAKKILLADPKRTILSIAYAVGFNSKTSFNNAFLKSVGTTPSEFRKQ